MLIASILFSAVVFQTRWQPIAQLPERFLLPTIALIFVLMGWVLDRAISKNLGVATLLVGVLIFHAVPFALASERVLSVAFASGWQSPENYQTDSEMEEAASVVGSGRSILLIASQGVRDYPLFDARHGFTNRVYPWGKTGFDVSRFQEMITQHRIDAIVFEQATPFDMLWDPTLDPAPFLLSCETLPDFIKLPTQTRNVVFLRAP